MSIGIPVKLLHESCAFIITLELITGELFRGKLVECQDNFNCRLEGVTYTSRDGRTSKLEHAYVRGSKIRMVILPDMLKNSPLFRKMDKHLAAQKAAAGRNAAGRGRGRGR
ncbi:uncharacterized protein LOC135143703 [Zophobas morio]|uniref:uncharacterized protein LOC135143703 n=1 Tax=Zophobas morio TaxID=2755281 RepID=UPI0030830760